MSYPRKGYGQCFDPLHLQSHPVEVRYLLLYLILLRGDGPFARFRILQGAARSRLSPTGLSRFGKASKTTSGAKKFLSAAPCSPVRGPEGISARSQDCY